MECYDYVNCRQFFKPGSEVCVYDTLAIYTSKTYTCKGNVVAPVYVAPVAISSTKSYTAVIVVVTIIFIICLGGIIGGSIWYCRTQAKKLKAQRKHGYRESTSSNSTRLSSKGKGKRIVRDSIDPRGTSEKRSNRSSSKSRKKCRECGEKKQCAVDC